MAQTDLKSDNFCSLNSSGAPFYWTMDPVQNHVAFKTGEVGVPVDVGLHTPGQVIGVSSMLDGRDDILTNCIPPKPKLPSPNGYASDNSIKGIGLPLPRENFENLNNTNDELKDVNQFLLPETTRFKGSAKDYSAVNFHGGFSGNAENLYTNPQLLTNVIERMWLQRGGLNSNQLIKQSWNDHNNNDVNNPKTRQKLRQPYSTKYIFGLPPNNISDANQVHIDPMGGLFSPDDVVYQGISSPQLQQDVNNIYPGPFNYNAMYTNGGCNSLSKLNNLEVCLDN